MGFYNHLCPGCMNEVGDAEKCPYCGFDLTSEQTAPFLAYGTVLAGKYVVGDILEKNGEGVTYLGLDTITNNCVRIREFLPENLAIRGSEISEVSVLDKEKSAYKKFLNDFLNMWHNIMRLKTLDSMITVLDVFEANNTAYAVAEADGSKTLSEFLEENGGTLDWSTVYSRLFSVLEALEALNDIGVIHGAISPDTLFLCSNGKFKPWGFSISECRKADKSIPVDIRPGYAAIEQYSNDMQLSAATDVYGFVAVLYKCVTGSMPIDAEIRYKDDSLSIPAVFARDLPDYVLAAFIVALQVLPSERTPDIRTLRASFTKEAFEIQKQNAAMLSGMSLIDPISDIDSTDIAPAKTSDPIIVNTGNIVPVLKKDLNPVEKTSTASTILLSISIVFVMVIFFICLVLTGIISFNVGGGAGASATVYKMPDFTNHTKDDPYIAQIAEKYGFQITLQPASSDQYAQGVIFEQNIAPGTEVARGTELQLTYSKGVSTVTLPDFTGMPFTETVYYLGKLNLSYNIIEKQNTGGQSAGSVATMSPAAGSIVFEGTEITIEIWGDVPVSGDITGPNTGSEVTSSTSILDSIFGRLSDSVSGLGSTIQNFFG